MTNFAIINGVRVPAPEGALAYKYADPTEDARWIYEEDDLHAIAREDPTLIGRMEPPPCDETRYYLDVRLLTPDGRENTVTRPVYGPFADRLIAEQTITLLAGRADVLDVKLRQP